MHRLRVPQRIKVVITTIYRQNADFRRNIVCMVNELCPNIVMLGRFLKVDKEKQI